MPNHLILRLDAPLMSFGAPIVDNHGRTERFMALSALSGLLANALGFEHRQHDKTQRFQSRLRFAQRCDRPGRALRDFQTVSLGQDFLGNDQAWTTWGVLDKRKSDKKAQMGTHIRYRDFVADAVYTLAFRLEPADEAPTLDDCARALNKPARPIFIGRKTCLPASPILYGSKEAQSPLDALRAIPRIEDPGSSSSISEDLAAWWSPEDGGAHPGPWREIRVTDQRDWLNQVHGGQRTIYHGLISPGQETAGNEEAPNG